MIQVEHIISKAHLLFSDLAAAEQFSGLSAISLAVQLAATNRMSKFKISSEYTWIFTINFKKSNFYPCKTHTLV